MDSPCPADDGSWLKGKAHRAIYKIRERNYGKARFLLHPRPQEDELLSSWLVRMAGEHFTAPATFTNLYLPEWRNVLWSCDLDLQADERLLDALEVKSGVSRSSLLSMTLRGYEGYLCERVHAKTGGTQFVLPLRMRARRNTFFGLRYCPECLRGDEIPYFRRKWRLAFSTACLRHRCFLRDRCPDCQAPLTIYRRSSAADFPSCVKCGFRLKDAESVAIDKNSYGLKAIERIYEILDNGFVILGGAPVYSFLFFCVLHQLSKAVYCWDKTKGFLSHELMRDCAGDLIWGSKAPVLEEIRLKEQYLIFSGLMRLFDKYPENLIGYCLRNKMGKTELTRDLRVVPRWYLMVAERFNLSTAPPCFRKNGNAAGMASF